VSIFVDILGDKIAIMKGGRIAALGTSLRLKSKYGSGYTVSVVSEDSQKKMAKIEKFVFQSMEEIKKNSDASKTKAIVYESDEDEPLIEDNSDDEANGSSKKKKKKNKSKKKNKEKEKVEQNGSTELLKSPSKSTAPSEKSSSSHGSKENSSTPEEVRLESAQHGVSTFKFPVSFANYLPSFFEKLEANGKKLGIHDFQLNMTTLEEVHHLDLFFVFVCDSAFIKQQ